jgi:glycosyltransferase involved in cell wall biosynthesis
VSITIVVPGKFQPAYHLAEYLEHKGRLERLITPIPYKRAASLGVSRHRTRCLSPFAYWNFGIGRYGPRWLRPSSQLAVNVTFGQTAARLIGEPRVFIGWCGSALECIRRAHHLGIPAVLQSGSAHIGWQTDILHEEFQRFGYGDALTHPLMVARCLREVEEADAIIVPSGFALRTFVERGVSESKLILVPWGVTSLTEPPYERTNVVPRILFVGSCSLRKGIPYVLDAFRRIDTPATLRLVGPFDQRLLDMVGGLPEGAEAVGPKRDTDLAAEYRNADIFVMASVEDGSPMAVLEAMHAGLPVVVSDHMGADQVTDGVNGFVVPARNASALSERLEELLADTTLRCRMGHAAAATVVTQTPEDFGRCIEASVLAPLMQACLR